MTTSTRTETVSQAKKETAAKVKPEAAKKTVRKAAPKEQKKAPGAAAHKKITALANQRAKELHMTTEGLMLKEIIRAVQRAEGNFDCFGTGIEVCDQDGCCWQTLCVTAS